MDAERGAGRAVFAAALLTIGGVLNVIWGIAAIDNANFFVNDTKFIISNLETWGWVSLLLGVVELIAAASLVKGGSFGRWFAIAVASLAAIAALLSIPAYPLWSIAMFALSLYVISGLAQYEPEREDRRLDREPMPAPPTRTPVQPR
jgi:hypothetical protein